MYYFILVSKQVQLNDQGLIYIIYILSYNYHEG